MFHNTCLVLAWGGKMYAIIFVSLEGGAPLLPHWAEVRAGQLCGSRTPDYSNASLIGTANGDSVENCIILK